MLTIHDLRFFMVLATSKSQILAAEHLGVTRAAVSQRLSILETRIGVKVADRSRGAIELTTAGYVLKVNAEAILEALDRLPSEVLAAESVGSRLRKKIHSPEHKRCGNSVGGW